MDEISFDFLDGLELESVNGAPAKLGMIDKQPTGKRIRVFNDGRIYPSQELIDAYQLEYVAKGNPEQGNGFDVWSTKDWGQWPMNINKNLLLIAPVNKSLSKVDLFGNTRYNEDGTPKAQVATQGASTFGKQLIDMIRDVYGKDTFAEDLVYLDLAVVEDKPLKPVANGIYTVPKAITKGKNAGKMGYERRENLTVYPLYPVLDSNTAEQAVEAPVEQASREVSAEAMFPEERMVNSVPADEQPASHDNGAAVNNLFNN